MNPTTVRLSDTLLLSDCVGCDSVYRYGHANPITWDRDSPEMAEAEKLAETLDLIAEDHGPYSVAYGYIHPALSEKIVKYQDPNKPSYHRWDYGAAVDVCFHRWGSAPVFLAAEIDSAIADYSRMITYAESEWICFGTRCSEDHTTPRRAFYENRYVGERKPKYITYSQSAASRQRQLAAIALEHDWRGQGYPSYHGGGRRQLQHHRLAQNVVLSDLLYKARYVHAGVRNLPPFTDREKMEAFKRKAKKVAAVISMVTDFTGVRTSVVAGYDHKRCWSENTATVEIVPNGQNTRIGEVVDFIAGNGIQAQMRKTKGGVNRVRFHVE